MSPFRSAFTLPAYIFSTLFILFGIALEFVPGLDVENFKLIVPFGYLALLLFMGLGIREVLGAQKMSSNEKWLWALAIVFANLIGGLVYVWKGRRRL